MRMLSFLLYLSFSISTLLLGQSSRASQSYLLTSRSRKEMITALLRMPSSDLYLLLFIEAGEFFALEAAGRTRAHIKMKLSLTCLLLLTMNTSTRRSSSQSL